MHSSSSKCPLEQREDRAFENMHLAIDMFEAFERLAMNNQKFFLPHLAVLSCAFPPGMCIAILICISLTARVAHHGTTRAAHREARLERYDCTRLPEEARSGVPIESAIHRVVITPPTLRCLPHWEGEHTCNSATKIDGEEL